MRTLAAAIGLSTLLLAPSARAQDEKGEKVALAWKFTKGEVLRYEMVYESSTEVAETEIKQRMEYRYALEAKEVAADGTATLESKYERVRFRMTGGPIDVEFDSDKEKEGAKEPEGGDADPLAAMKRAMLAMVGKAITLKMTAQGKVLEVAGFDKIIDAMGDDGAMMKQMFGDEQIKQMFQSAFAFLPGRPVGVGDAWDYKFEFAMPMLGRMKLDGESKLRAIQNEGKTALMRTNVKITVDADEDAMMAITDGKAEIETVWSVADGRMDSQTTTMKMKVTVAGQEADSVATITMKLAPKAAPPATGRKEY